MKQSGRGRVKQKKEKRILIKQVECFSKGKEREKRNIEFRVFSLFFYGFY